MYRECATDVLGKQKNIVLNCQQQIVLLKIKLIDYIKMGNGIVDSLKEAKGILKLLEAIFCLLGAIGISALTSEWIYVTYAQLTVFTIGLAGGCFVALAMLVSYLEDKDNHIGELIFTMTYGILNIIIGILSAMNLDKYGINRGVSSIFVPLTAFVAGILFIIDFVREVRK